MSIANLTMAITSLKVNFPSLCSNCFVFLLPPLPSSLRELRCFFVIISYSLHFPNLRLIFKHFDFNTLFIIYFVNTFISGEVRIEIWLSAFLDTVTS